MNKEIEELLNDIKIHNYEVLNREYYSLLLSYIEQLENNRDKAIELYENDDYSTLADDMYEILKGDSDE